MNIYKCQYLHSINLQIIFFTFHQLFYLADISIILYSFDTSTVKAITSISNYIFAV